MKEYRTYTVRIFPTMEQEQELKRLSLTRNTLYNTLIGIEQRTYENEGRIKSEYDLDKLITQMRREDENLARFNAKACQRVAKEIFGSYRAFFALVKKDKTAKPPRQIESVNVFHTIVYSQSGWKFLNGETVRLNGIELRYKGMPNLNTPSLNVKEVKLKFRNGKYLLDLGTEEDMPEPETVTSENRVLAIDLGLKNLVNGVDNNGSVVTMPNKAKRINQYFRKQIAKVQSKLSVCKKGSHRDRRLRKVRRKLYNRKNAQVRQALHAQSKKLAGMNYRTIVVGDLSVKQLMSTKKNRKKNVRRSFDETCVSTFVDFLTYKCRRRQTEVETVSERWTTQTNCLTGKLFKEKVGLGDRVVRLNESIAIDRDLNAAVNIMRRYEQNHLALLTAPLDVSDVVRRYNLLSNTCSR